MLITPLSHMKPPPQLHSEMTHPQFHKFKFNWDVYKKISNVSTTNLPAQFYHVFDDALQHNFHNTVSNFFSYTKHELLENTYLLLTIQVNALLFPDSEGWTL